MNSLLNTRFSGPLSASLLLLTVGSASALGAVTCYNQPPTPANPRVSAVTGAGPLTITTSVLGRDADLDPLVPVFDPVTETGPVTGAFGGTLAIHGAAFRYTPPTTRFDAIKVETFKYGLADNHGATVVGGTLSVTLSATPPPPPCDLTLGGAACFGQTWDGRWFTMDQELKGEVLSLDGRTRVALFHPSKAAYLNPDPVNPPRVIAIFPNPSAGRESYWGCGAVNTVASTTLASCDLTRSLRGDVTYVLRLPVVRGLILNTTPKVTASDYLGDQYRSYFFALSRTPTVIAFLGKVPSGEPAGCMGFGNIKSFSSLSCNYLSRSSYDLTKTEMLYLKMQAAPGTVFNTTTNNWTKIEFTNCDSTKKCRLYVNAW
jgi:hypothetical protein